MSIETTKPHNVNSVLQHIADNQIKYVDLKFVDLLGTLQHVSMAVDIVDASSFVKGVNFDGSSVRGFQSIHQSDMTLMPDPKSMFVDPFFDNKTVSFFCDVVNPHGEMPYDKDPRGVARRAERLLRAEGIADEAFFGPELEFFVFDEVSYDQQTQHGYYFLDSDAGFWNAGDREGANKGHRASRKQAYFAAPPTDKYHNLRCEIAEVLREVGMSPELHHHEVGAAGQCEIGFKFGPLMSQADAAIKYKYVVKNMVDRLGKTATFMPKPLLMENGSGMHVNMSLFKGNTNLFYESGRYADLSEMAEYYVGGILKHARALCAFVAPTTNSYRRLVPGYEAPVVLAYSQSNRSASIRIPIVHSTKAKRVEFRTPDPSSNPYLAFSAILMAGIDGIQNKIKPPAPIDEDIFEMDASELGDDIGHAPMSLDEAILALEDDHMFLMRGDVFGQDLLQSYINFKRENELDYIRLRPHPAEFTLYFNS